jgi:perosamine synthetase
MGFNYRLADLNAALGLTQMRRLESFIAMRQRVHDLYVQALAEVPEVIPPAPPRPGERISWFVFVVRLRDEFSRDDRDSVLNGLRRRGVACRNYFVPIHLQPYMRERFGFREGMFPVTEAVAARTIALPFHNRLSEADVAVVATALREAIADLRPRAS